MARRYRDLVAWQRSHELTLAIYKQTQRFPTEERYGVTSQLRRAAYSDVEDQYAALSETVNGTFGALQGLIKAVKKEVGY